MSPQKFDKLVSKITKQFGAWCTKNNVTNWDDQKEFLTTLLIRNKLLKTDQITEFWHAAGSVCDFVDDPVIKRKKTEDWKWEVDIVFCVLYIEHCVKKWTNHKTKESEYV